MCEDGIARFGYWVAEAQTWTAMIDLQALRLDSHLNASQLSILVLLAAPVLYYLYLYQPAPKTQPASDGAKKETQTVMQPENPNLLPPQDTPFTLAELKQFDGSDATKPIYVAIKGASSAPYPSEESDADGLPTRRHLRREPKG